MVFYVTALILSSILVPFTVAIEYERITALAPEKHSCDTHGLEVLLTQKTNEMKYILRELDVTMEFVKGEVTKMQEQKLLARERLCTMEEALMLLLQEENVNLTEDMISRLQSSGNCEEKTILERRDSCLPVPVDPEETIGVFSIISRTIGNCTNAAAVHGINKCVGHCSSTTTFSLQDDEEGRFSSTCSCCKPSRFEKIAVELTCENGMNFSRNFDNIAKCQCLSSLSSP